MKAHPLAAISPLATIGRDVQIGPFCVVEPDVVIEDGCILESSVVVKQGTTLGPNNHIFEGAVIGGLPQHIHMPTHPGRVVIGSGNVIREYATVHRALDAESTTIIGDNNLLMIGVHIAHDCRVGSNVIFANQATLAGHVTVDDRAYLSGMVGVHQFCRVGSLAMLSGHARIVKDVPPFVTVDGQSSYVVGLNLVGLRRAGYTSHDVEQLKAAYRILYRSGLLWLDVLQRLRAEFPEGPAARFYEFLSTTKRGIVPERRMPPETTTLKIHREADQEPEIRTKAG